jgi:hypothetical protein
MLVLAPDSAFALPGIANPNSENMAPNVTTAVTFFLKLPRFFTFITDPFIIELNDLSNSFASS